jgi:hypothetical protein
LGRNHAVLGATMPFWARFVLPGDAFVVIELQSRPVPKSAPRRDHWGKGTAQYRPTRDADAGQGRPQANRPPQPSRSSPPAPTGTTGHFGATMGTAVVLPPEWPALEGPALEGPALEGPALAWLALEWLALLWPSLSRGGLGSGSPLFGQYEKARSAMAVIVKAGLAPGLAGMPEPSATYRPGHE